MWSCHHLWICPCLNNDEFHHHFSSPLFETRLIFVLIRSGFSSGQNKPKPNKFTCQRGNWCSHKSIYITEGGIFWLHVNSQSWRKLFGWLGLKLTHFHLLSWVGLFYSLINELNLSCILAIWPINPTNPSAIQLSLGPSFEPSHPLFCTCEFLLPHMCELIIFVSSYYMTRKRKNLNQPYLL